MGIYADTIKGIIRSRWFDEDIKFLHDSTHTQEAIIQSGLRRTDPYAAADAYTRSADADWDVVRRMGAVCAELDDGSGRRGSPIYAFDPDTGDLR